MSEQGMRLALERVAVSDAALCTLPVGLAGCQNTAGADNARWKQTSLERAICPTELLHTRAAMYVIGLSAAMSACVPWTYGRRCLL